MATMRDVAERAGVSVTSVSHVINETRAVSDELRARILAAMSELEYQPNRLARSLRSGKSQTIGIIIPDNSNPFFAEVVRGVEATSFAYGYSLILCISNADLEKEEHYIGVLIEKQVDGILFMAVGASTNQILSLQQRRVPVVVVDREVAGVAVDTVLADNARGGWLATRHLLELGHKCIACITGHNAFSLSAERVDGYRRALHDADIPPDEALIVPGDFSFASGYDAIQHLLALRDAPTAVFACNDYMAVGAICAAVEMGRLVPADLSVIGFDDVLLTSFTNPPLTTIAQPCYDMGVAAATLLLERMHDPELPTRRQTLGIDLKVRGSTAPLVGD
ncbi:MAG: LacI family DNA-binding transcriptional regulator [Caldilineales bacterium]|nr:LacI family DNA-binding transcriptional regulator [Caldilineales bacterium]